jgi:L-fuconolactonase
MIDTHTHIVGKDERAYPLKPRNLSGEWYLEAGHSAENLAACMDEAGVEQAVLVQAVGAYTYENDYAADSAAAHPKRFASACCIDPLEPDAAATLEYWVRKRDMHGVRIFAIAKPDACWLEDERTFPVWERAGELGAHVIVTVFAHQLEALGRMLRRFPEVRVSLDHCGFPALGGSDWNEAGPLFALADHPNIYCKVSSIVLDSAAAQGDAASFVSRLVSLFGAERLMWGSDFPQTHDRTYPELVALARSAFGGLTEAQREQCFTRTPRALWPSLA